VSPLVEGVGASPGRALGPVCRLDWDIAVVVHRTIRPEEVEAEVARFDAARAEAVSRLATLGQEAGLRLGPFEGKVFEAQAFMIEDPVLVEGTRSYISENFLAAERAFELQMLEHRVRMLDSGHAMVLDKLADLQDVRLRVLSSLLGVDGYRAGHRVCHRRRFSWRALGCNRSLVGNPGCCRCRIRD